MVSARWRQRNVNEPEMCERIVKEMADKPGVHGFTVTSVRNRPVHHNSYMKLYRMIEETGGTTVRKGERLFRMTDCIL